MKLSILLLSILGLQSCFATTQFLNLVPYQNAQCSGSPSGYGVGGITNTCLTFDFATNWLLQVTGKSVQLTPYYNVGGVTVGCEVPKNNGFTYNVGDCVAANELWIQNNYIPSDSSTQWYYKLQVSQNAAFIEPNSIAISYMYPQCELENALMVQYFTNGSVVYDAIQGGNEEFYCENNTPYTVLCNNGDCNPAVSQDYTCEQIQQFINTSTLNSNENVHKMINKNGNGLFGKQIKSNSDIGSVSVSSGSFSGSASSVTGTGSASASSTGSFSSSAEDSSSVDSSSSSTSSSSDGQFYFSNYCS